MAFYNYEFQIGKLYVVGTVTYTDRCDCNYPSRLHAHIDDNHIESIVDTETDEYLTITEQGPLLDELKEYGLTPTSLEEEIDDLVYQELEEEVA